MLDNCTLCPHRCNINRLEGNKGRCKCDDKLKIALASIHMFEEPCISGKNGSGTVFFSNCNLNCIYCQNYEISNMFLSGSGELENNKRKKLIILI